MAKPVARYAVVLKSAWGIDHGIEFLVLIMAFFWFLKVIFLPFSVLIKTPSKSISDIDFEGAIIN